MRFDAVVLAGRRPDDPLAAAHGVASKALIELAGEPMLRRVLRSLEASGQVRRAVIVGGPELDPLLTAGSLELPCRRVDPAGGPSVSAVVGLGATHWPALVTTADHALLTGAIVREFAAGATASRADLAIGFADTAAVQQRFPGSARTPLRFAAQTLCGCNLFAFMNPAAMSAARWWQQVEQQRKRPWRLVRTLGVGYAVNYLRGRLSLDSALVRLGELTNCELSAVLIEQPEAAFDVDCERDLETCRRQLAPEESAR